MKKLISVLLILSASTLPVLSEEIIEKPSVKRFGIEAGLGLNVFLPFLQLRASYRLPYNDNRWDVNLSHSIGASFGPALYISSLGTKYYFADNNPKPEIFTFQPFLSGAIAASYYFNSSNDKWPKGIGSIGPAIFLGIGTDLHIIDNLQLSGAVYTGYPALFRPELNLKVRF